jgi:predicted acetyltransferase
MTVYRYIPLGDDEELRDAWARSGGLAFTSDPDIIVEYLKRVNRDAWCRVLVDEHGSLAATLMRTKVGMYFCGGRVSTESVGFVSVPPEHRGNRVSVRMMHEHLREAHHEGSALSVLYSARARLYRGVGYETAGRRNMIEIPIRSVGVRSIDGASDVAVREMTDSDLGEVQSCYTRCVQGFNGALDRDEWFWGYTLGKYAKRMRPGFVFERDGNMTGYVVLTTGEHIGRKQGSELHIYDLQFGDAPTGRAIVRFLTGFTSTRGKVLVPGDTSHPLFDHIDELWHQVIGTDLWMIRVLDIERAIAERGFSSCLSGRVVVELADDILPHNAGSWVIEVQDGKGSAARTDEPAQVKLGIDTFAPIFSGFASATQMMLNGRVEGDNKAVRVLDGLFAATTPWMSDDF